MDAVVQHGQASIEKGSSSFAAAARLFDPALREDVWQLYAWCRHCDDEIDGQDHGGQGVSPSPEDQARRLARLRALTDQALAGAPLEDPALQGLQRVALKHDLDPRWPRELLDGFAMDVAPTAFETQEDTLRYCWGVAGVVGVMMATLMGARDPAVWRRAQDLGLAFQLTNICRDVREDALNGRVYLPAVALSASDDAVFAVVRQQLALAEAYYDSAREGLRDLPFRGALAVAAARRIYRQIGRRILQRGPQALASRSRVSSPMKAWLFVLGTGDALWSRVERLWPALPRPDLWSRL